MSSTLSSTFERNFTECSKTIMLKETNETWERISKALLTLIEITTEQEGHQPEFIIKLKPIVFTLQSSIISPRTQLSHSAVKLVAHLSEITKKKFTTLVQPLIPAIIETLGRTNVLFRNRASECLTLVIRSTQLTSLIPLICGAATSKSGLVRPYGIKLFEELVNVYPELALRSKYELLETTLKTSLSDSKAEIRSCARSIFWSYLSKLPDREPALTAKLPREIFKYLSQGRNQVLPTKHLFASPPSTQDSQLATAHSSPGATARSLSRNSSCSSLSAKPHPSKARSVIRQLPDLTKVKSKVFSHLATKPPVNSKAKVRATPVAAPQPQPLARSTSHLVTKSDKTKINFIKRNALLVKNSLSHHLPRGPLKKFQPENQSNLNSYKNSKSVSSPSLHPGLKPRAPGSAIPEKKKSSQITPEVTSTASPVTTTPSQIGPEVQRIRSPTVNSTKRPMELDMTISAPSPKRRTSPAKLPLSPEVDPHSLSHSLESSGLSHHPDPERLTFHHVPILREEPLTPASRDIIPLPHPDSARPVTEDKVPSHPINPTTTLAPKSNRVAFGTKPFLFRNRVKPNT